MCPERLALPRGIVALRPVPAGPGPAPGEPVPSRCVPLPPPELKEIQRRAFERGRACEREELGTKLRGLLESLARSCEALDAARAEDRRHLARFGVEVAIAAASDLVGSAIRSGSHDVRAQVETLLEEALPGIGTGALQVAVNPEDLDALAVLAGPGAPPSVSGRLRLAGDPELPRGACRVRAGGAEILADPKVRLAAIAERLRSLAGSEHPDA